MDEEFGEAEIVDDAIADDAIADDVAEFEAETPGFEPVAAPAKAPAPAEPSQQPYERVEAPRQQQTAEQDFESHVRQTYEQWQPKLQQWANTPGHIGGVFARNPIAATHAMFSFLDKLDSDPRGVIAQISQAYGVQPDMSGEGAYQAQSARLQTMLDDFIKDKPHYQELRPHVVQEIVSLRRTSPTLPPDQTLRLAYYNVMDRTGYNRVLEQRREAEHQRQQQAARRVEEARQKAKAIAARKSTAVNVKSGFTTTSTPRTMNDTLMEIANKHYGR